MLIKIFYQIHHFCAADFVSDRSIKESDAVKKQDALLSLAATPLLGIAAGTIGLVVAIAGVIIGGLGALCLILPAICNIGSTKKDLVEFTNVFIDGLILTVAYPVMMIYGQTYGWRTHNIFCNGSFNVKVT